VLRVRLLGMAKLYASTVHLVRVTRDDREQEIWAAATSREDAVDRVLDAVPEGWSAVLLDTRPTARDERCRRSSN